MSIELVLVRHGESEWNRVNKFTGWADVDLSSQGATEAMSAGKMLKNKGYTFDLAFTSMLKRANKTLNLILEELDLLWLPVEHSWRLNERHYGALQGLNKTDTAEKYGEEQVKIWRRSYDIRPPLMTEDEKRASMRDPRYQDILEQDFPLGECLKDTVDRVVPYWEQSIVPVLKSGKRVLIVAHGNSLRALIKYLDQVSDPDIVELNVPTGQPLVYTLNEDLKPIKSAYLADPEAIKKAQEAVANQGKAT